MAKKKRSEPRLQIHVQKKKVFGRDYDPGSYRPGLGDLWQKHKPSSQAVNLVLGALVLFGLVLLFATWGGSLRSSGEEKKSEYLSYSLTIKGKLRTAGYRSPLRLTLGLPDIPYQETWVGSDFLGEDGAFEKSVEIRTKRPAGLCLVTVSTEDEVISKKEVSLNGSDSNIDLGFITRD